MPAVPDPAPAAPARRCLQVDVAAADADRVSGELWAGGATGVQELPLGGGRVRLVAGIDSAVEATVVARLRPAVAHGFDAHHDGWLDAWRPFARPVRVGSVVVHPPWEPPPWPDLATAPTDVLVAVDPGRAFGAGNHPTTRLMLAALPGLVADGATVLDVGCGSGVLAVVAARLGAARVVAVDLEDEAVRATSENAERNGVGGIVHPSATPVAALTEAFDVVLANILAPVLVTLAPAIAGCGGPTGRLVLSGMLAAQADGVAAAYARLDPPWRVVDTTAEADTGGTGSEWVRLTLGR